MGYFLLKTEINISAWCVFSIYRRECICYRPASLWLLARCSQRLIEYTGSSPGAGAGSWRTRLVDMAIILFPHLVIKRKTNISIKENLENSYAGLQNQYSVVRYINRRDLSLCIFQLLQDTQLIFLICMLLVIDVVVVTLWVILDPMQRHLQNLTLEISSQDRGVVYQPQVTDAKHTCSGLSRHLERATVNGHSWTSRLRNYH